MKFFVEASVFDEQKEPKNTKISTFPKKSLGKVPRRQTAARNESIDLSFPHIALGTKINISLLQMKKKTTLSA